MMYGYGSHIDEVEDCRSSENACAREEYGVHNTTSLELRKELWEIYRQSDHSMLFMDEMDFSNNVSWRVYSEWCMDPKTSGDDPISYDGSALTGFIDREIRFATRRLRKLKKEGVDMTGLPEVNDKSEIRKIVLEGLVKRGIELFSDWNGGTSPYDKSDKRNLRSNLKDYVRF